MPKPKVKKKSPKVHKTKRVAKKQFHSKHETVEKDIIPLSFKLPATLHARIKASADAQERSVSHFITMKLAHLFPEPPKAVRKPKRKQKVATAKMGKVHLEKNSKPLIDEVTS